MKLISSPALPSAGARPAALAALLIIAAVCGCRGPGDSGPRLNAAEQMMWSTYPVGTNKGAGTGIAVSLREAGVPGGTVTAVVTSAHVLESARNGPVFIALRLPDGNGNAETAILRYAPPRSSESFYVRHPHHDVAAFAIDIPPEAAGIIELPTCLDSKYIGSGGPALHAGDEVFFAGFPEVMPFMDGTFPILRSGRVASYPAGTPEVNNMFCINADAYPGDSGAPVFSTRTRGRPRLAGMIVQRVEGDKHTSSHLAIAVHSSAIRETLELLAARERRTAAQSAAP